MEDVKAWRVREDTATFRQEGERAGIVIYEREVALHRYERRFEWVGPKEGPARVRGHMADHFSEERDLKTIIHLGPWRLRKVSDTRQDFITDSALYVREEGFWRSATLVNRTREAWERFTARAVLTCMIWGIGHVPQYAVPRWSDLARKRVEVK